jgi:hypothetical protein
MPRASAGWVWVRGAGGGKVLAEKLGDLQPIEEVIDDEKGSDAGGGQGKTVGSVHGLNTSQFLKYVTLGILNVSRELHGPTTA